MIGMHGEHVGEAERDDQPVDRETGVERPQEHPEGCRVEQPVRQPPHGDPAEQLPVEHQFAQPFHDPTDDDDRTIRIEVQAAGDAAHDALGPGLATHQADHEQGHQALSTTPTSAATP